MRPGISWAGLALGVVALAPSLGEAGPSALTPNRTWELFSAPESDEDRRALLRRAADLLSGRSVNLAGVPLTPERLLQIASSPATEPLLRSTREVLRRPVDLDDLLLFLDDLVVAGARGEIDDAVVLPPGRARSAGVLLHPDDIFRPERAKRYGDGGPLMLRAPTSQEGLVPAKNGASVGPRWAARFRQPRTEKGRLRALAKVNPDFARRVDSLMTQLRDQGAWTSIESTVRKRERGFLIYGSYWLGQAKSAGEVRRRIRRLDKLERSWGLRVPIRWRHRRGWRATVRGATALAETFGVDYATRGGAKRSDHYDGGAVDIWAVDLPRRLALRAPDGAKKSFDLSAPDEPRDLSLTPALIEWIEAHFGMDKLERDYPHWSDATASEG